jgi:hypothetical protein
MRGVPSAEEMRGMVMRNFRFDSFTMRGRLRTEGRSYSLLRETVGREVKYHFMEQGLHVRVEFRSGGNEVWIGDSMSGPWRKLQRDRYGERVLGSDATYGDLSLDFLHWGEVSVLGRDSVKTVPAYVYEAVAPARAEGMGYDRVRYWVGAETYALLRADGYDKKGRVVKRMEVNGVIRLGDAVTIKELQISTLIPGRDLSASRTYIEIQRVERRVAG